jgi:hypothetical protein
MNEIKLNKIVDADLTVNQWAILMLAKVQKIDGHIHNLFSKLRVEDKEFEELHTNGWLEDGEATEKAKELLASLQLNQKGLEMYRKLKSKKNEFEEFWKAYPASDKWGSWPRTRVLRAERKRVEKLYYRALKTYKHEEMMQALEYEVLNRKRGSTTENRLSFMPAAARWLNGEYYVTIFEEIEAEVDEQLRTKRYGNELE